MQSMHSYNSQDMMTSGKFLTTKYYQYKQYHNIILSPVHSARYVGVIIDKYRLFTHHISAVSKSCLHNICDLRRVRNIINQTIAIIIATSRIRSKIDYCNSLLITLPAEQTNRLQLS